MLRKTVATLLTQKNFLGKPHGMPNTLTGHQDPYPLVHKHAKQPSTTFATLQVHHDNREEMLKNTPRDPMKNRNGPHDPLG